MLGALRRENGIQSSIIMGKFDLLYLPKQKLRRLLLTLEQCSLHVLSLVFTSPLSTQAHDLKHLLQIHHP
jgi:hypothetical protein